MIRRHTRSAMGRHWFIAVCWLFLRFSGFALLAGDMQPVGAWWRDLWLGLFGERGLLVAHLAIGTVWVAAYALYIALFCRGDVLPFLRAISVFHVGSDLEWCAKKGLWLVLGPRWTMRLGVDPALPPQGFYNAGQRMVAIVAIAASVGLAVTGIVMGFFSGNAAHAVSGEALQWSIVIHFCCAGVMAVLLPVHVYMAALAPGEGPALRSMFTGCVPEEHAARHNPLWFEALRREGRVGTESDGTR